ncbi:MAG: metallophosphoesterase [Candidatus Methylacidiphilales bacterium]
MFRFLLQRKPQAWDLIGDIHGHAAQLEKLLTSLGYTSKRRVWSHPERKALFLGDYINRGPDIRRTVDLVRAMVEHGFAEALLGNHEHNALIYEAHEGKNLPPKFARQLQTTQQAYAGKRKAWSTALGFFLSLPVCIEKRGFRAVHACWSSRAIQTLGFLKHLQPEDLTRPESPRARAIHLLLNGPEIAAPPEVAPEKVERRYRIQWWRGDSPGWADAGYPVQQDLKNSRISSEASKAFLPYSHRQPPLFFGHYGFAKPPEPIAPHLCCLDLAVSRGGSLAAYRWDGEKALLKDKCITAKAR